MQRDRARLQRGPGHAREQWQRDQRRDDREILEQQDREGCAAVTCRELVALGQHLQDQRGRRQRQREPDHERCGPGLPEQARDAGERGRGHRHLGEPGAEHGVAQHPEPRRLQLEADRKQQHHDAELGEMQDAFDVGDDTQTPGTDDRARRQVTEHGTELEAAKERHRNHGRGEKYRDLRSQRHAAHLRQRLARAVSVATGNERRSALDCRPGRADWREGRERDRCIADAPVRTGSCRAGPVVRIIAAHRAAQDHAAAGGSTAGGAVSTHFRYLAT